MPVEPGPRDEVPVLISSVSGQRDQTDRLAEFFTDASGQLISVEAWQADVDDRDVRAMGPDRVESVDPVVGLGQDLKALAPQQHRQHFSGVIFVFDQDDTADSRPFGRFFAGSLKHGGHLGHRQTDHEFAPGCGTVAMGFDRPPVHFDQRSDQRQPHPHAPFASIERIV